MMNSLDEVLPDEGAARGQENKMDELRYTWTGASSRQSIRDAPRSGHPRTHVTAQTSRQGDEAAQRSGLLPPPPALVRTVSEGARTYVWRSCCLDMDSRAYYSSRN